MHSDPIEANEIRRFEEQYAENPESFVFARLADAYRKAGNPERALEILEKGLRRHPEYMSGHIVRARCLTEIGRGEEAGASWRNVLELDPQNLVALRQLAELAREAGDRATARAWAERLLHVDPLNEEAAVLVAETAPVDSPVRQEGEGAPRSTVSEVPLSSAGEEQRGEEIAHDAGMLTETMADLYAKQGLYEEAAEIYWELVKRHPADPKLRERLAEAQARATGERAEQPAPVVRLQADRAEPAGELSADSAVDTEPEAEGSEPIDDPARAARAPSAPAESHDDAGPETDSRGPRAGIRGHLQALIRGSAAMKPVDVGRRDDGAANPRPGDEAGESASTSFGEWLDSRGR